VRAAPALLLAFALTAPVLAAEGDAALPATAASAPGEAAAGAGAARPASKKDPFEGFNRSIFGFNETLDAAVLKPVAQAYHDVVPEYVRTLVTNVIGNVADAWSAVNHLLQGKVESGLQMGFRFAVNSVLGFGGLLDIGSEIGLEKQSEDFGQTLGKWGVPAGPYVVLPVLGPSTVRDTSALPLDLQATPASVIDSNTATVVGVTALQVVSARSNLLGASRVLDDIALDKYSFLRDAYLARRQSQVYDGNPPETDDDDEDEPPAKSEPAPSK
jgi:phospholipid-binding lipoprotein MlaA